MHRPLGLTSLYDDLKESGYEIRSEVLSYEVLLAKESQAAHLNTAVGSEIVQIRRLRFIDDAPLALMNNLIPFDVAPSFSELNEQGLYACMRKREGCRFGGPDYAERDAIAKFKAQGRL